jgi:hypothetical protein
MRRGPRPGANERKYMFRSPGWILLALIVAVPCAAQTSAPTATPPDYPRGRISGYMFGDYYYNLDGNPNHIYDAAGNDLGKVNIDNANVPITDDLNGIQLRRVYFQLDNDLSVRYATRFRLEADSKSLTSDGKLGVNVKAAYLQAKSIVPRGDGYFGMMTTPTFENPEEFWGYRALEKTIADFQGIASSADLGLEMKGFADAQHHIGYSAMVGNGVGQKTETNRYKRFYLALPLRLGDLRVEPYADYEPVRTSAVGNFDKNTWKVFAGYELRKVAVGMEALSYVKRQGAGKTQEPAGVSVYVRGTARPTVAGVARFDRWYSDLNNGNRIDNMLMIAGIDWQPYKDVHIMPNVEAKQYVSHGNPAAFPSHNELQGRVTFYYRFSRPQSPQ